MTDGRQVILAKYITRDQQVQWKQEVQLVSSNSQLKNIDSGIPNTWEMVIPSLSAKLGIKPLWQYGSSRTRMCWTHSEATWDPA